MASVLRVWELGCAVSDVGFKAWGFGLRGFARDVLLSKICESAVVSAVWPRASFWRPWGQDIGPRLCESRWLEWTSGLFSALCFRVMCAVERFTSNEFDLRKV